MSATTLNNAERLGAQGSAGGSAGSERRPRLSATERVVRLCTAVEPGEGRRVALFAGHAFLLLLCYYVLKTIREPLLLADGSAELKSYAYAAIAAVSLVLVPLYAALARSTERHKLTHRITVVCLASIVLFYALGRAGFDVGFAYYVWLGVFGVAIVAQFWAHAAHYFERESGERLFPAIMAGAAIGGLAGPKVCSALFPLLGPWNLLVVAAGLLAVTLPLAQCASCAETRRSRQGVARADPVKTELLGGLALVLRDRYLLLLAVLAVLLNCVNTTGDYILAELVIRDGERQVAAHPELQKSDLIAAFYGNYYFAVNALSLLLQLFVVARIFRWIGVRGALLVLPVIAIVGYGLVVFVPVFAIIRAVKILENSADYSIMNTARHALYLPLPVAHQYEGKTTIDTLFWRLGDLVQAALIFVGSYWLGLNIEHFAVINIGLAAIWLGVAVKIGERYATAPRRVTFHWRAVAIAGCSAAVAIVACAAPSNARAAAVESPLFTEHEPIVLEMRVDAFALCPHPREECAELPVELLYRDASGAERRVVAFIRARGKWRAETGHCTLPPLFVSFREGSAGGTPFERESMLPLTTHCRTHTSYEQYVLKEYLAYRIYNVLADKSLRVRLVRITYRETGRRERVVERYGFFTEHFESLAARHVAQVAPSGAFAANEVDANELATLELFEYLIGNTDWSAVKAHNVVHLRDASGSMTAVPYDFDFSGLVNAAYAGPPPNLPIRDVTQRLFRGFCRPDFDWQDVLARFRQRRAAIEALVDEVPDVAAKHRSQARRYIDGFFDIVNSPERVQKQIIDACRAAI